jgi:internalin A
MSVMKVKKHHQLKNNSATTLSGVRPLGTLFVFFFVSSFPVQAVSLQETTTPRTFADWCLNKNKLSVETLHTINTLLQVAETTDCNQASKLLSDLTELSLDSNQIADLKPLSTLTNLTTLFLSNNQIADLKPLSTLTNLTTLFLSNNQIADLKPLSTLSDLIGLSLDNNQITDIRPLSKLTNLSYLWLENNQIADLVPLSNLTKLDVLFLSDNPSLTDTTCPVKPASTCRFISEKDW